MHTTSVACYLRIYCVAMLLGVVPTIVTIPNKGLVVAVNLEGLIDCSNLVDATGGARGVVHYRVDRINRTIIRPLNVNTRRPRYNDLSFMVERPLHMTLAYIGALDDTDRAYTSIVGELKEKLQETISDWLRNRSDKKPLACTIDKIIWPPLGKQNVWLAYGVQIAPESQNDLLRLINDIQSVLSDMGQEYYGCFRDADNNQKIFKSYSSLDAFKCHVSLGRFDRGYNLDQATQSVFGLPGTCRERIDDILLALPLPTQPHFDMRECALIIKDLNNVAQIAQVYPLSSPLAQKGTSQGGPVAQDSK